MEMLNPAQSNPLALWPGQARSSYLWSPARSGPFISRPGPALNAGNERNDDLLVIIHFFKNANEILPQRVFRSIFLLVLSTLSLIFVLILSIDPYSDILEQQSVSNGPHFQAQPGPLINRNFYARPGPWAAQTVHNSTAHCQGNAREFQSVWRVVTQWKVTVFCDSMMCCTNVDDSEHSSWCRILLAGGAAEVCWQMSVLSGAQCKPATTSLPPQGALWGLLYEDQRMSYVPGSYYNPAVTLQ